MSQSAPASERALRLAGLRWKFIERRAGPGAPALLLLPGTLGSAEIFGEVMQRLGRRAHMVSVTYPQIDDIGRLADGLALLLDRLGIARASVAGSSLGGFLAQHFAARHPQRVDRLLLGNTLWDPAQVRRIVGGRPIEQLRAAPATMHSDMVLASVRTWPEGSAAQRQLKLRLLDSGKRLLGARALKMRVLAVQAAPKVPRLAIAPGHITVLDCADDPLLPRQVQDQMVRRYPGANHVRLDRGGHYPYVLHPDEYCAVLGRLLAA